MKNKRLIILSSVGMALIAGASVFAYQVNKPTEQSPVAHSYQSEDRKEEPKVAKEQTQTPTQPVETVTESTAAQQPAVQQQPQPVVASPTPTPTYKWASQMAAAGIAESDYQYVSDMVLDDNGWRVVGAKVWHRAAQVRTMCGNEVAVCLQHAHGWVINHYGSWQAANASWNSIGNF